MVLLYADDPGRLRYVNRFRRLAGGAESNVAIALRRLGIPTGWFSRLGDDEFGSYVYSFLRGEGVDISRTTFDSKRPTGVFFKEQRHLTPGKVLYYRQGSAASAMAPEHLDIDYIRAASHLHISGVTLSLSDSCRATVDRAISVARSANVRISFDANIRLNIWNTKRWRDEIRRRLSLFDEVYLTEFEAQLLTESDDVDLALKKVSALGASTVAIKHGSRGATVAADGETVYQRPWPIGNSVQSHGAGDAFAAGLIARHVHGLSLREGTALAALLGAAATAVTGNVEGLPTSSEAFALLKGDSLPTR